MFSTSMFVILALLATPLQAALPAVDSQSEPLPTLAPMLQRTIPAVVNIVTTTVTSVRDNPLLADPLFRYFFNLPRHQPQQRQQQSLGSGVVVDAERGLILTNHHVIDGADEIAVNLANGETLQAELVGSDSETDIALLRVEAKGLTALPLADSDQLQVGDFVVAIGNPFGLGQTVTSGIVSALGRSGLGIEGYENFIQTDASINPGNSGGALVNLRGELVGLNTAILSKSGGNVGIGFAIPSNMSKEVLLQLLEHGEIKRGSLGISIQDITPELAEAFGLKQQRGTLVTQLSTDSPAARSGLQVGDVITAINGRAIRNADELRNQVGLLRVGSRITMEVLRHGKRLQLTTTIETPKLANLDGAVLHRQLSGAILTQVVEQGRNGPLDLVVISAIERNSAAQQLGLEVGDIIAQANRRTISTVAELQAAAAQGHSLLLNIQRGREAFFVLLK